jgi:cytochrome c-type biogenesis protein CcmH/NrfG
VKAAPDSFEGWFNLGVASQKLNRLEQAGQAFSEAIRVRPESGLAYANLGATLQECGEMPEVRKAYERVIHRVPENRPLFGT